MKTARPTRYAMIARFGVGHVERVGKCRYRHVDDRRVEYLHEQREHEDDDHRPLVLLVAELDALVHRCHRRYAKPQRAEGYW